MKKNAIRILSLLLVVMTLVGAISLPVSAYSYPMNYTITYKTSDAKCWIRKAERLTLQQTQEMRFGSPRLLLTAMF